MLTMVTGPYPAKRFGGAIGEAGSPKGRRPFVKDKGRGEGGIAIGN